MNDYLQFDNKINFAYLNKWKNEFDLLYDRTRFNLSNLCTNLHCIFSKSPPISLSEVEDVVPKPQPKVKSKKDELIEYFQEQLARKDKEIILL